MADAAAETMQEPSRRDFLYVATAATAAVGVAATAWPFIDQMNPDAATVAAGGPVDIDLRQVHPGQQLVVLWSSRPVFVVNRTKAALEALQSPQLDREAVRPELDSVAAASLRDQLASFAQA